MTSKTVTGNEKVIKELQALKRQMQNEGRRTWRLDMFQINKLINKRIKKLRGGK